jgi:probable HAF family extracellular repeat protein
MTDLGTLGGESSWAYRINARGQVVGTSTRASGMPHAFLWDPKTGMTDLGTLLGGEWSVAYGINALGQVVGQSNNESGWWRATIWKP